MAKKEEYEFRTYGNWKRPESPGILGLGIIGTSLLAVQLILSVIIFMNSVQAGILWFVLGSILMYVVVRKDKHNNSILYRAIVKIGFNRQARSRRNIYISGPLSRIPSGHFRLPGIGANVALNTFFTPSGHEIGVLTHNNRHLTLVLASEPEGAQLFDNDVVDLQVARYGQFLNLLSDEPGLKKVTVTLESEPESGLKLQREVNEYFNNDASAFARNTMQEIANNYSVGSSSIKSYVALTYSLAELRADKRSVDEILRDLVARIPILSSLLEASGAGVCTTMSAAEIYRLVRSAYAPNIKNDLEQAMQMGDVILDWENVGPRIALNEWNAYITDNYVHKSYVMSSAPRGEVGSTILTRLLTPHHDFVRKRVTLIYDPMQFEQSSALVEADLTNAQFRASSEKRPTARQEMAVRQARQTAAEEARGANLIRFGMVCTITLESKDNLTTAEAALGNLSAGSHVVLRSADGTQDSAFLIGLPLGIPVETFYSTFDAIKDMI